MRVCWKCGKPGATIPDPCCAAPDCEHKNDYIHLECMSMLDQARISREETGE